ncbi:cytokinin dehydrogenase 3-like protein, partial [Tanacetum coccineum]
MGVLLPARTPLVLSLGIGETKLSTKVCAVSMVPSLCISETKLSTKVLVCLRIHKDTMNDDTPVGVAFAAQEGVTPSVVYMTVEMGKISSLDDTTVLKSFPPLSTLVTTTVGNTLGKSSYANITGKPNGNKVNVRTLFTPGGNGIDVVVLVDSIRAISERFANTAYGFFLGKKVAYPVVANYVRNTWGKYGLVRSMFSSSTGLFSFQFSSMDGLDAMLVNVWVKLHGVPVTAFSEDGLSSISTKLCTPLMLDSYTFDMCMQSWGRSSYARVMIELRADVELKDNIAVAMPKITREGHYNCNVRVEYKWKPLRCSSCKVFGHINEECPKNTGVGEKKTVKKPSQTSRGVPVGPKIGFKPQKEYRPVLKKSTASSSGNKKKGVEPTIKVGNLNPLDVLNSVDNDGEFGTNSSNTPIGEKINKIEQQICKGKLRLLDNDGNPLVPTGIMKSDSEVEVVFDETTNLRISTSGKVGSDKGYGTNSLMEQCRDSYPDNDDYDLYDDDMYENHDMSEHLQSICDDLDITFTAKSEEERSYVLLEPEVDRYFSINFYVLFDPPFSSSSNDSPDDGFKPSGEKEKKDAEDPGNDSKVLKNTVVDENIVYGCADDPNMYELEEISRFSDAEDDDSGADMNNLDTHILVSPIPTTRIHKDHPIEQIIGDIHSTPQT